MYNVYMYMRWFRGKQAKAGVHLRETLQEQPRLLPSGLLRVVCRDSHPSVHLPSSGRCERD